MTELIPATSPHMSLNRVRIVDLPGLPLDDEVRGRHAYDLLSASTVLGYAIERAESLRLPAEYLQNITQARFDVPRWVDHCLSSSDPLVQGAAEAISKRLGRNLGYILLTLHRGDAINREARPEWSASDWERWGRIRQVWIGGGLMSGHLGQRLLQHTREFLDRMSYEEALRVSIAPYTSVMALVGAARYLPPEACQAICLDAGGTLVKRACLGLEHGTLRKLQLLPSLPVELAWPDIGDLNPAVGKQVLDFLVWKIVQTLEEARVADFTPGPEVMLSLASYVQGGRLLGSGIYAALSTLADDIRPVLSEAVATQAGRPIQVHLIHDGTAAAAVCAGQANAAVIVVGTALGIGFPPDTEQGLRRMDLGMVDRQAL